MVQQRGMKRAEKVLKRSRKLKAKAKEANMRKLMRQMTEEENAQSSDSGKEASEKKD